MTVPPARVVQVTDSHLSARLGVPREWTALARWLAVEPPDLVVHTGDIVCEDPDDAEDLALARRLIADLKVPVVAIPGNHDIGAYGEDDARTDRLDRFVDAWGSDRFVRDLAGWRLIGIDAYLLGEPDHDRWLTAAVTADRPAAVFLHQPLTGDPSDGWEMPTAAADAFRAAVAGRDVRVVASGHRHCAAIRTGDREPWTAWWAPSLRLVGKAASAGPGSTHVDPRPGVVEHVFSPRGGHQARVVRPADSLNG